MSIQYAHHEESPQAIAEASTKMSNKFWAQLPKMVDAHNKLMQEPKFLAEKMVWRTSNFLGEAGDPLNTKNIQPEIVHPFFEQWYLPFQCELFCFSSMFKNKKCSEILVQFASEIYDLKRKTAKKKKEKKKNVVFHCF